MLDESAWAELEAQVDAAQDAALMQLRQIVALPTVAHPTRPNPALYECAELLVQWLRQRGSQDARIIQDYANPLVLGRIGDDPSKPTMLVYGHFDVQDPGNLEAWSTPPFECTIRDGRIFARGSGDNKGQFLAHLLAIDAYRACSLDLPVNLLFVFDGEEEVGSRSLAQFAAAHPEELEADLAFTSDGPMHQSGLPTLVLGSRGLVYFHIRVRTLRRPGHSYYAPVLPSAAWRVTEILASLRDQDGRIAIAGFYDDVIPPTAADMDVLRGIPPMYDAVVREFEPQPAPHKVSDEEFYRKLLMEPALNVAGLVVGDTTGNQTVLPHEALLKLEVLTVPGQRSDGVVAQVREHMAAFGVDARDVEVVFTVEPSRTPPDHPLVAPMTRALERVWGVQPVVMNRFSSYAPYYIFDRLGLPGFYMPYAQPDQSNHAPNENLSMQHFRNGVLTSIAVFDEVGDFFRMQE